MPKVFLSVGSTSNDKQEAFVKAIEEYMKQHGLLPQTVGRSYFSSKQPLVAVADLMEECVGTVILAYERMYLEEAIEKRGNPREKKWSEVGLPTVWNQIEATMGYMLDHPLLVIVEHELKSEGLLETGNDWYVKSTDIDPGIVNDPEFVGMFADWQKRVVEFQQWQLGQQETDDHAHVQQAAATSTQRTRSWLTKLRNLLTTSLSPGDLELLTDDLGLDYGNLPGAEFRLKVHHLIKEMNRRNRLDDLLALAKQMRPEVDWES